MKKLFFLALFSFILPAQVHAATLTVYPDAGSGSTTVDGYVERGGTNQTLADIRSGAGTGNAMTGFYDISPTLGSSGAASNFATLRRAIVHFSTSALGAGSTITGAVLSLYLEAGSDVSGLGNMTVHIAGATTASNNTLANTDYGQVQTTSFASIAQASLTDDSYNDFTLNGSGVSNVSKTGVSKFSVQSDWDINNSFTGSWSASTSTFVSFRAADVAGTSTDPKLVVTYTPAATFTPRYIIIQ